ncbi:MAG: GNAT family N-acetyltransferase [Micrococcales bacterium]|nr:GNAT family N-acetyltransferase [Micrococcales bacterium]
MSARRFRAARPDAPDARRLLEDYFAERTGSFPIELGRYRAVLPAGEAFVDGVFLVLDADGEPRGCAGIRRLEVTPPAVRYEVKHLWVRPEARGGGHGRALLEELERRARELGATELVLDTNRVLEAAGALYARLGYARIEPYNDNPNATDWYRKDLGAR